MFYESIVLQIYQGVKKAFSSMDEYQMEVIKNISKI